MSVSSYLDAISRLRDDLARCDYRADAVLEAIGEPGQLGLTRNHSVAATRALAGRDDGLTTLIRLFVLQQAQPAAAVEAALHAADLVRLGLLAREGDGFRALVDIRPYSDATHQIEAWVVSDHAADLDTRRRRVASDHVLGVSPASVSLAQITPRGPVGGALDLGTGCGVMSLYLSRAATKVVATDLNPRALTLATLTFALNRAAVTTRYGSLYEPVAGDTFDLIATNPPFVIAPADGPRLAYRETEFESDGLMRAVVHDAGERLAPGGSLHVVGNWAHVAGADWRDRLAGWVPEGCDAFFTERERLDVYEYAELWLADAGWAGTDGYRARYDRWLAYFDAHRIESVGLGWVTMVKSGHQTPRVRCEAWGHPVAQLVGDDLMAHLKAMDYADWSDDRILEQAWTLAPGAVEETLGQPGLGDPSHISLRRTDGLMRATAADTALAGVLGACDGELALGSIVAAVAQLTSSDPDTLVSAVVPRVRDLIAETWLSPGALR